MNNVIELTNEEALAILEARETLNEMNKDVKAHYANKRYKEKQSGRHVKKDKDDDIRDYNYYHTDSPGVRNMEGRKAKDTMNNGDEKTLNYSIKDQENARKENIKKALKGEKIKKSSRDVGEETYDKIMNKRTSDKRIGDVVKYLNNMAYSDDDDE